MNDATNTILFGIFILLGVVAGAWTLAGLKSFAVNGAIVFAVLMGVGMVGFLKLGSLLIAKDKVAELLPKRYPPPPIYPPAKIESAQRYAVGYTKNPSNDQGSLDLIGRTFDFCGRSYVFAGYKPSTKTIRAVSIESGAAHHLVGKSWPKIRASLHNQPPAPPVPLPQSKLQPPAYSPEKIEHAKQRAAQWAKSLDNDPDSIDLIGRMFEFRGQSYVFAGHMPSLERVRTVEVGSGSLMPLNDKFWPSIRASLG